MFCIRINHFLVKLIRKRLYMHVSVVFFQTDNKYQIEICQKLLNREEINPVLTFFCKTARVKGDYSRSCNIMIVKISFGQG